MKLTLMIAASFCLLPALAYGQQVEPLDGAAPPIYELRMYYAKEGKLDALHARFRDHTMKLFEDHGMTNVGYWVPIDNPDERLIYLMQYPSREARDESWRGFLDDEEWKTVKAASERDGVLVERVESYFLKTTDYSSAVKVADVGDRVFELRIYTTSQDNLPALDERFRQHTMALFKKHGMTNLYYFHLTPDQKGAENTLVYFLAHPSHKEGLSAFESFRADPDWIAALKASEKKAGGPLTIAGGVKSLYLKPTDYSPTK